MMQPGHHPILITTIFTQAHAPPTQVLLPPALHAVRHRARQAVDRGRFKTRRPLVLGSIVVQPKGQVGPGRGGEVEGQGGVLVLAVGAVKGAVGESGAAAGLRALRQRIKSEASGLQ